MHVDSTQGVLPAAGHADTGRLTDVPAVPAAGADEPASEGALREADGRAAVPGVVARVEAGRVTFDICAVRAQLDDDERFLKQVDIKPLPGSTYANLADALTEIEQLRERIKWNTANELTPDRRAVRLEVLGVPGAKGSARAFINRKTGRAFVAPGGAKSTEQKIAAWSTAVREAAARALGVLETPPFVETALAVTIVFHMQRPKSHYGTGKNAGTLKPDAPARPTSKPDIDKIARSTLDALTGGVFDDDSRIADLSLSKRWASPGRSGATITIAEAM